MGQTLSEPVTDKHTTNGQDHRVMYAASSMQGWRSVSMEDAHTTIPEYKNTKTSFFASSMVMVVSSEVANYSGEHLHHRILDNDAFRGNKVRQALKQGYLGLDDDLRSDPLMEHVVSGCTAVSVLITKDNTLYVGNAGDSRAVLSTDGQAVALSEDHKPTDEKETQRIKNAGGHVEFGRVNGNLALSRALGDFEFKQRDDLGPEEQAVTADPDITEHRITEKDDFVIIACDGIWDCMTNQEAVNFVRAELSKEKPHKEICETMMDHCLASEMGADGLGCDNMTVILVALLHNKSSDEWYHDMAAKFVKSPNDVDLYETKEPNEIPQEISKQPQNDHNSDSDHGM
ncbi:phosphatase 2C-domain-containing protein [Absidia repens]|uniref:protein-serine/threonine phosphatase n=1 Tax=Absidia repens TaxID=90262 RepID=A0A1X2IQ09_9FUNG|nr:phosphatase 2C-domain-containing protein [Absidia repens]